jgi:hypothetical protein
MSTDVELQKPDTLEHAMVFACAFERRTEISDETPCSGGRFPSRSVFRGTSSPTKPPPMTGAPGSTPTTPGAPVKPAPPGSGRFTRLSLEEMTLHRLDGLCYNCPAKFSREHIKQCTMKVIYFHELDDVEG